MTTETRGRTRIVPCRILTVSGVWINALAPDPTLITLMDVAWGLRKLRWGAHRFATHTVAAHTVLCAEMATRRGLSPRLAMLCLHHDDGEFVWGDVPSELKRALLNFSRRERVVWRACLAAFVIVPPGPDEARHISLIDRMVARCEDDQLRPDGPPLGALEGCPIDPDCIVPDWTPDQAAHRWMNLHKALRDEMAESQADVSEPRAQASGRHDP